MEEGQERMGTGERAEEEERMGGKDASVGSFVVYTFLVFYFTLFLLAPIFSVPYYITFYIYYR